MNRDIWYCFLSKNSQLQFLERTAEIFVQMWEWHEIGSIFLVDIRSNFFPKSYVCWYVMTTFIIANDYNSLGIVMSVYVRPNAW